MPWYKFICKATHMGAGTHHEQVLYIFNKDIIAALEKYKYIGGVKRDSVPNITTLTQEEQSTLEKALVEEKNLNPRKARNIPIRYYKEKAPV
ncbi:MAG: hypothetical protein ABIH72_05245 [archaeon]